MKIAKRTMRIAACALVLVAAGCARSTDRTATDEAPIDSIQVRDGLRDGLYAVIWEASDPDSAALVAAHQAVLPYDRKYSGSEVPEPRTYLALDTSSFVPLILEGEPDARPDDTGRSLLSVTLAREYMKALEDFTAQHLDQGAAIVLNGEAVSMHKIRAVIREGKLQITRCDSNSCEVLRTRLTD